VNKKLAIFLLFLISVGLACYLAGIFPRFRQVVEVESRTLHKTKALRDVTAAEPGAEKNPTPANGALSAAEMPLTFEKLSNALISPDDAKILLARCDNEIPDITRRAAMASTIIGSLCKQGFINEAWGLIKTDPGKVRTSEIATFFTSNNSSSVADLSKMISSLQDPEDQSYAIFGVVRGCPETLLEFDSAVVPGATLQGRRMFGNAVTSSLKEDLPPEVKKGLIDRSIQLAATGKLETGYLSYILDAAHPDDFNAQWESLREYRKLFDPKILESVHGGLAKKMVNADMAKAMDLLSTDPATKYSYPVLSSAVTEIYKADPAGANTWMTNNLDRIDPATSQRIISCVAQVANQNLEFETSRKWANRILNAEVRQQLLAQVDKREAEKTKPPSK
jgi:hypothetical protein